MFYNYIIQNKGKNINKIEKISIMLSIVKKIVESANKLDENGYIHEANFLTKIAQEIIAEDFGNDGDPDAFEVGEHGYLTNLHGEFLLELTELIYNAAENIGIDILDFKHNIYFNKYDIKKFKHVCEILKEKITEDTHPRESGALAAFKLFGDGELFKFSTRNKKGFNLNLDHRNKIIRDLDLMSELIKHKGY